MNRIHNFLRITSLAVALGCVPSVAIPLPAYAQQQGVPSGLSPEALKDKALIDSVQAIVDELKQKLPPNTFGVSLSRMESPSEILAAIGRLEAALNGARGRPFNRPVQARTAILQALEMLYRGRGSTTRGDGKGWFPINRSGATGLGEIDAILRKGLLDQEGKDSFLDFVKNYDYSSPGSKTSVGFPPASFNLIEDSTKQQVLALAQNAPVGAPMQAVPAALNSEIKLAHELLQEAESKAGAKAADIKAAEGLLGASEANHYDNSVKTSRDTSKGFTPYYGREDETQQIVDALTKSEKSHVLLSGKAGVGKTTLLKKLSDDAVQGKLKILDEKPPLVIELPITAVTNKTDPNAIKGMVDGAKALSRSTGRRVILFVDEAHVSSEMTRNALKGFLTEANNLSKEDRVNMIFATTSAESREFLKDSAFSRRFTDVHVAEFDRGDTIQLIKTAYVSPWKKHYIKSGYHFDGIDDDALEYAYRYGSLEQPHAGNPTGTKELLEAAISRKMNAGAASKLTGPFRLTADDARDYIKSRMATPLVAGDPKFEEKFAEKWAEFESQYVGNDGAKTVIRDLMHKHFGSMVTGKMTAVVAFGPPGGGKTYAADTIAKTFFNGAELTINGAEFKNGGLELNKLIGSPPGTVGSEEQRSMLTKFIQENPQGGVIKIEEADYLHQDVIQFLTNMNTDKKFTDGLGKEWDTSRFVIWMNSNIGQDLMIPKDSKNKMSWDQFNTRRHMLTEKAIVNGHEIEQVKPAKLSGIFDQFIGEIVTKSNPGGDTSSVAQEANKQKRRYKSLYILPPDREELTVAAHKKVQKFVRDAETDYGVKFDIPAASVDKLLDIDHYEFEKGYSYVGDQIDDKLLDKLTGHLHERGQTVSVKVEDSQVEINGREIPTHDLVVHSPGQAPVRYPLGAIERGGEKNPWKESPEMMARIKKLVTHMSGSIKGNESVLEKMKDLLKLKSQDWSTRPVITLLGTSGNGKTETFKALAKHLYGDSGAFFKITGLNNKYALANYFRPPTGIEGGKEETEFERWLLSRANSGGGVICFDELLSFDGLSREAISGKLEAFNELYDLLDEGFVKIGNKTVDARGFVIGITGNSLQDAFKGIPDDPSFEKLVKETIARLDRSKIVEYLGSKGMDAPKVARLGEIHVMGPQPKGVTFEIGQSKVNTMIEELNARRAKPMEIHIDPKAIHQVVDNVSSIELGMRDVDRGFQTLIKGPLAAITSDITDAKKLELRVDENHHVRWFVNDKPVGLEGVKIPGSKAEERNWAYLDHFEPGSADRTPQLADVGLAQKLNLSPEAVHSVAVHEIKGHWMADVMLNRRNKSDEISLIPGKNYLGYVRPESPDTQGLDHISSMLKEAVVLDAGHRAVFLEGSYATGGGDSSGKAVVEGARNDDLGKIDQIFNRMIHNRLIPGLSEQSNPAKKALAKQFLGDVLDHMTDAVIKDGDESGQFEPIFNHTIQTRFANRATLDQAVKEMDLSRFGDANAYFAERFDAALSAVSAHPRWTDPQAKATVTELQKELKARVDHEVATRADPNHQRVVSQIREADAARSPGSNPANLCKPTAVAKMLKLLLR